jgi:hypothetical protein
MPAPLVDTTMAKASSALYYPAMLSVTLRTRQLAALLAAGLLAGGNAPAAGTDQAQRTLALVKAWVGGQYNNRAQFERDLQRQVPPAEMHRTMHQFFAPVTVAIPGIAGYLVYQHASLDGSARPEAIFRVGLLQFFPDPKTGQLVQRELNFRDGAPWKNAYLRPDQLRTAQAGDFIVNPGCDFYLATNAAGTEVRGTMPERSCTLWSEGLKMTLYAQDAVLITPQQYGFWGRFVDAQGTVRWGTASRELNLLDRVTER